MTHKDTVDAVRLSLLLADSKADRRLGILRGAQPVPAPSPLPVPIPSLAPEHHYVLPTVIPTMRKNARAEGWGW